MNIDLSWSAEGKAWTAHQGLTLPQVVKALEDPTSAFMRFDRSLRLIASINGQLYTIIMERQRNTSTYEIAVVRLATEGEAVSALQAGDNPDAPVNSGVLLDGENRPTVDVVYDNAEDRQMVRSLRLPTALYKAAIAQNHPAGFPGVVRDALEAHLGQGPSPDDIRYALTVIERAVGLREAS